MVKTCALTVEYGQIPEVLLLGNGINRAFEFASWDELIQQIGTKQFCADEEACIKRAPYPLQPVILTGDHVGTKMKEISADLSALKTISQEEELLRKFASLHVDAILTTNYTFELEKSINPDFKCLPRRTCNARMVAYSEGGSYNTQQLHTYFRVDEKAPPIWHIHGEASRHNTMILGHYYYGKLLAKMQQYVSSLIARRNAIDKMKRDMEMRSWLDYFLLGEVHIVGLGMALSEMDLWWLINCKKRHFADRKVILYKPDIKPEERLLAEAYGVVVRQDGYLGDNDYKAYYEWLCGELGKIL